MRYEFDWDPAKERINIRSHQMSFRQASAVFRDPYQLSIYDETHSEEKAEDRWTTLGLDRAGRLCVVIHTFERLEEGLCRIRIISARKANSAEMNQYQTANP